MKRIFFLLSLAGVMLAPHAYAITAQVEDISNRAYYAATLREIDSAKGEIYAAIYSIYITPGERDNPACRLVEALINAHKRGVAVKVYLDKNSGNDKANFEAYKMLKSNGVAAYYTDKRVKLHTKLIVIDKAVIIDGSANWTKNAVETNVESNNLIRSPELATLKLGFFEAIDKAAIKNDIVQTIKGVKVESAFLIAVPGLGEMVQDRDEQAFDIYMLLKRNGLLEQELDYVATAQYLNIPIDTDKSNYRAHLRRAVDKLKAQYKLVDYTAQKDGIGITLLQEVGGDNIEIPCGYWDYGLDKGLSLKAKAAYLICVNEGRRSHFWGWWRMSLDTMEEKYHIDKVTLSLALGELKKQDLLMVRKARAPGKDYSDRRANEYCLKPLLSPQMREKRLKALETKWGKEDFTHARAAAARLDEENNLQSLGVMLNLAHRYGIEAVEKAVDELDRYGDENPLKNLAYLRGIVKRIAGELYR